MITPEAEAEDSIRRVRSLCSSLESILICAETVEQNSAYIGSALFMVAELKDAIEQFENAMRGWTTRTEVAND